MFVTLNGGSAPVQSDLDEVCPILKNALTSEDAAIDVTLLNCILVDQNALHKKRQTQSYNYVASLTYPTDNIEAQPTPSSATIVAASFFAAVAAFVALFA